MLTLKDLPIGKTATVKTVGGDGSLRQHLLDMGIIPEADVTMVKYAPMGDPVELRIHSYELTLRLADAERIEIENIRDTKVEKHTLLPRNDKKNIPHPGLGEGGKYHTKETENPLPDGTVLTFALAGNQNCGKTTLFNQLTGSNQHVGNFPGVTVDRKDGAIKEHSDTLITDLPGIYSMSPYSSEEIVTREFILNERPKGIINIVDATNIERNLNLTLQLMELDIPMVLALNMMDEVWKNGGYIHVNEMEQMLGIPVVPISAAKNEGIAELVDHALHVAKYQEKSGYNSPGGRDHPLSQKHFPGPSEPSPGRTDGAFCPGGYLPQQRRQRPGACHCPGPGQAPGREAGVGNCGGFVSGPAHRSHRSCHFLTGGLPPVAFGTTAEGPHRSIFRTVPPPAACSPEWARQRDNGSHRRRIERIPRHGGEAAHSAPAPSPASPFEP